MPTERLPNAYLAKASERLRARLATARLPDAHLALSEVPLAERIVNVELALTLGLART